MHPPAITIYAWRRSLFTGWKNSTVGKESCNVSDTFDKFVQCVNDKTFKLSDILLYALNGNDNLTKDAFWAEEIAALYAGKSHSLTATQFDVNFDFDLELSSGQNYSIFIHDPK